MAAPATVIVGRRSTTPDDFYGDMGSSEIRAYVANNAPKDAWIRRARYRGGRQPGDGTPRVRVVVYSTTGGGPAPNNLMYTFPSTYPGTTMSDSRGGELVTVNVASADKGFLVDSGVNYALAFQVNDNSFRHNMAEAADISGENEQFYYKSASSPPNPYGSSTVTTEGHMTLWLEGDENLAPLQPINVSPNTIVNTITPLIEADFRDPNGTYGATAYGSVSYDAGDYMQTAQIQVRRKSDLVSFWDNTYTTTTGERTANRSSKTYAGTTLVRGTVYQVRVKHFDRTGSGSPFSEWVDFTPGSLGVVTLAGNPTGKVDDITPDVQFTWTHQTPLNADRAIVKFYKPGIATPVATSATVTLSPTVATGGTYTIPWASLSIAGALTPGQQYQYTVEARATDLIWSSPSAKRTFTVDAAPGVPTNLSPANSEVRSTATYPVLSAKMSDADDTVATGLVAKVEILTGAGVLISTRSATLRSGTTDQWDYQTIAADLAAPGSFRHRWYSGDGYLWSGGVEVEASATRSAEALFSWAAVPSPVITFPLGSATLTSETTTVTWTVTSQDKFRVRLIEAGAEVFNSGWITNTTARTYPIPIGKLRNGHTYDLEVGVEFSSLQGFDTETSILMAYTPPASLGTFTVLPSVVGLEPQATAAVGTWLPYTGDFFEKYVIYRSDLGTRPYLEITNVSTTQFTDYHAPAGNVVYSAAVVERRGLDDLVSSELVSATLELNIRGVVLVSIDNPQVDRYVNVSWEAIEWREEGNESYYQTWGSEKPIKKRGTQQWQTGDQEFRLYYELIDPQVAKENLEALARGTGFSYRDKYERKFATIPAGSLRMARVPRDQNGGYTGSFSLVEVAVIEGVEE